jgi:hypothetical protein
MNLDEYGAHIAARMERFLAITDWDSYVPDRTHWVYRYWNDDLDEGHRLLYVGFTGDFHARDSVHLSTSGWRHFVTRIDMDPYPDRDTARAAEAVTIRSEVPVYNIHKNPRREEVHGEWLLLQEARYAEYRAALARAS